MTMRSFPVTIALAVVFLSMAVSAKAQNTDCIPSTAPVAYVQGSMRFTFTTADYAAVDALKVPIVTDYLVEVRVQGQAAVVTNYTLPKTSMTLSVGAPANCYSHVVPVMTGLLPVNFYTLTPIARGPGGATSGGASGPFHLPPGAPLAPANSRLQAQ